MKKMSLLLIFLIFLIVSCGETTGVRPENRGLAGFRVDFADDFVPGTEEKRRNDPVGRNEKIDVTIKITALGYDNKPLTDYNGKVEVSMLYGKCLPTNSNSDITLVNGYAETSISMKYYIDKDRVVVEEIKDNQDDKYTGKMGFSQFFYTSVARIPAVQSSINGGSEGLYSIFSPDDVLSTTYNAQAGGRNLTLKAGEKKEMVVIAVMEGGFYLQEVDADDEADEYDGTDVCEDDADSKYACDYSSIYMYTYSTPYVDDNIDKAVFLPVGTRIESANGSVFEFAGFTEMSFPNFHSKYNNGKLDVKDKKLLPKPKNITKCLDLLNGYKNKSNEKLEACEASLVTVKNVSVGWFRENETSFVEFSQFPLITKDDAGNKRVILAQTISTVPTFDILKKRPETEDGESKCKYDFTGILKQHKSAVQSTWIIVPRYKEDIKSLTPDPECDV